MHSNANFDLCCSRQCNICLLLQNEKRPTNGQCKEEPPPPPPKLRNCNGCQLVRYCSTEHQRIDWPIHREFCVAMQKIMSRYQKSHPYILLEPPRTAEAMNRATLQVKYLLRATLGRPLQFHEEELTSFPAHCAVCFSFRRLKSCERCYGVSYCSDEHAHSDAERHSRQCGFLQLYYCAFKVQPLRLNILRNLYQRVSNLHKTDLVDTFQRSTLIRLPAQPNLSLESYQLFSTAADFSCIGTICYSLGFMDMRSYDNCKFVIFILGATVEQELWFRGIHIRFFFLQFPAITKLELYFIGPEVVKKDRKREEVFDYLGVERSVVYFSYGSLFQNFCKVYNIKPSLIIAYNCGFSEHTHTNTNMHSLEKLEGANGIERSEKDTWSKGITEILQTFDLPIVFTSFTSMEADFDYAALLRVAQTDRLAVHVERIFNVKQNPYRDLRPLRSWHLSDKEEIYYRNGYVQAVRTRLQF